jgi:ATP-binding protein involved in chromosome partitioning
MSAAAGPSEAQVLDALRVVQDPDLHRDIVALGFVKNLRLDGGRVAFDVELTTPACPVKNLLRDQARQAVAALPGVTEVAVTMTAQVRRAEVNTEASMRQVRNVIAVASGKGGVGKSTVATNLALALARQGAKVGILDADVYGPSVTMMLGGAEALGGPGEGADGLIKPAESLGLKFVSMGLFTDNDTPVIWRGPMASKLIQEFVSRVDWGELDYLLVDLPPGTGDVQLTLTQITPLMGALIVTTPQDVAVGITMRGLRMFEKVRVPILGLVENMSTFVCPHCAQETPLFRRGGGQRAAAAAAVPFLGEIPLDAAIAEGGDHGVPIVVRGDAAGPSARAFLDVAQRLAQQVSIVNESTRNVRFRPDEVEVGEGHVLVRWSDGHVSRLEARALRGACPCAECVDEVTGERRVGLTDVAADVRVTEVRPVGRYAFQLLWSDGHQTGIYTFDYLRSLDPGAPAEATPRRRLPVLQAGA